MDHRIGTSRSPLSGMNTLFGCSTVEVIALKAVSINILLYLVIQISTQIDTFLLESISKNFQSHSKNKKSDWSEDVM